MTTQITSINYLGSTIPVPEGANLDSILLALRVPAGSVRRQEGEQLIISAPSGKNGNTDLAALLAELSIDPELVNDRDPSFDALPPHIQEFLHERDDVDLSTAEGVMAGVELYGAKVEEALRQAARMYADGEIELGSLLRTIDALA